MLRGKQLVMMLSFNFVENYNLQNFVMASVRSYECQILRRQQMVVWKVALANNNHFYLGDQACKYVSLFIITVKCTKLLKHFKSHSFI